MIECPKCPRKFKGPQGLSAHQRGGKCEKTRFGMSIPISKEALHSEFGPLTKDTLDEMKRRRDRLNVAIETVEGMMV